MSERELKQPKFKRCKISRHQLLVLMEHFGTRSRAATALPPLSCAAWHAAPQLTSRKILIISPESTGPAPPRLSACDALPAHSHA